MTKGVKITITAVSLVFIAAVIAAVFLRRLAESRYASIIQDGTVLYTIDLSSSEDKSIVIEGKNGGYNTVKIKDGTICISEADCPDQTCVKTGVLRSEDIPIVCLPHRLVIRYTNGPESAE